MIDKVPLRKHLRAKRDALPAEFVASASDRVRERVLGLPEVNSADTLLVYCSAGSEVETYTLIEDLLARGQSVAVPVITGAGLMAGYAIHSLRELAPGAFGILAPRAELCTENRRCDSPGVVLLPGVGFDPETGHRIGTGGGYYDRFLTNHPAVKTVGLAFDEQLAERLPAEPHDVPVSVMVTPTRVIRPQSGR